MGAHPLHLPSWKVAAASKQLCKGCPPLLRPVPSTGLALRGL